MDQPPRTTFFSDFRKFFARGLIILLPSLLTLFLVVKIYQFVDQTIAEPINRSIRFAIRNSDRFFQGAEAFLRPAPEEIAAELEQLRPDQREDLAAARSRIVKDLRARRVQAWWNANPAMDLIGLAVAIIAVYIAGRVLGSFLGRRLYHVLESFITRLPVFKQIYPHIKQIVDFIFSDDQPIQFNRVVAVEYPRKGIWSLGFQTGTALKDVIDVAGDARTIFIPSSPTPFTGYTITVPAKDILELPLTVEEAIRFTVSGGVLIPSHQFVGADESGPTLPEDAVPHDMMVSSRRRADDQPPEPPTDDGNDRNPPPDPAEKP